MSLLQLETRLRTRQDKYFTIYSRSQNIPQSDEGREVVGMMERRKTHGCGHAELQLSHPSVIIAALLVVPCLH